MARTKTGERLKRQAEVARLEAEAQARKRRCTAAAEAAAQTMGIKAARAKCEECQFAPPIMTRADRDAMTDEEKLAYVNEARVVNRYKQESGCTWHLLICAPYCVKEDVYTVHAPSSCQKALKFLEVQMCHYEEHGDGKEDPGCEQCQAFEIYMKYHGRVKRFNARMKQLRYSFKHLEPAVHELTPEENAEEDEARGVVGLHEIPDVDGQPVQWEEVD